MITSNSIIVSKPINTITLISKRECTILEMIAVGLTSEQIASQLFIAEETVKTHCNNLNRKLQVRNTAHLIRKAFDHEILIPNIN